MKNFIIKQDINFLDKPLWFQNLRHDGLGFVWNDIEGYVYRSGYKLPDKVDILILLYLLLKSQRLDYQPILEITRYEILKECGLPTGPGKYYERVEDSLQRWTNVAIEFKQTFYESKKHITIGFGIIDDYKIDTVTKQLVVHFNHEWLAKIQRSEFFKYLNFAYYKALKRPITRRFYELACKSFLGRDEWSIGLAKLGAKLTLTGDEVRTKEGIKRVIYASKVLVELKPAINELNRLAKDPALVKATGIKQEDLFSLTYKIVNEKQERVIVFKRHPVTFPEAQEKKEVEDKSQVVPEDPLGQSLFALLKRRTRQAERVVREYYEKHGEEYVRWNILYSNEKSKQNYPLFLKKALAENWAEDWKGKKQVELGAQVKKNEEEKTKCEERQREVLLQEEKARQQKLFGEKFAQLDLRIKQRFWQEAETEVEEKGVGRRLMVKLRFTKLILKYLKGQGENFDEAMLTFLTWDPADRDKKHGLTGKQTDHEEREKTMGRNDQGKDGRIGESVGKLLREPNVQEEETP